MGIPLLSMFPKNDLTGTFVVMVGKAPAQRFTLSTSLFTSRSGFFNTARNPERTNPSRPILLEHEDPQVFSTYLNCVQFGIEALNIGANAPEDDREPVAQGEGAEEELGPDVFLLSETEIASKRQHTRRRYLSSTNTLTEAPGASQTFTSSRTGCKTCKLRTW